MRTLLSLFAAGFGTGARSASDKDARMIVSSPLRRAALAVGAVAAVACAQTAFAAANLSTSSQRYVDTNGGVLVPGEFTTCTITIRNTGDAAATACALLDALPAHTSFLNGSTSVNGVGVADWMPGPLTIQSAGQAAGVIAAGDSCVIAFAMVVDTPLDSGTLITNAPSVSSSLGSLALNIVSLPVTSAPNLTTGEKRVVDLNGAPLQPGETLEYTIKVPNIGTMNATGAAVTDAIPPAGTTYVPGSTRLNGSVVADNAGVSPLVAGMTVNALGQPAGSIPVGDSAVVTVQVTVDADAENNAAILNTATATDAQGSSVDFAASTLNVKLGQLTMAYTTTASLSPCDEATCTLVATNNTTASAFDAVPRAVMPAGWSYVPGSATVTPSGGAAVAVDAYVEGDTLSWNRDGSGNNPGNLALYDVAPGGSVSVSFQITAATCSGGNYTSAAFVSSKSGLSGVYAQSAVVASPIAVLPGALALTLTPVQNPAAVGQSESWTCDLRSTGDGAIGSVAAQLVLQSGLQYDTGTPAPTQVTPNGDGTTTLTWDQGSVAALARMAPGAEQIITLQTTLLSCFNNTINARGSWGCGADTCQTVTASGAIALLLNQPQLAITLNPSPIVVPSCDGAGAMVTLTVANSGGPARGLDLLLSTLPGNISLSVQSGATLVPGAPDTLRVGDVDAGGLAAITLKVTHTDNCDTGDGTYIIKPRYTDDCGAPFSTPVAIGTVTVQDQPAASILKTGPVEVKEGENGVYTLTFSYGEAGSPPPSGAITIVDTYPSNFTFVSATPAPTTGTNQWDITAADLAGTGPYTYSIAVTLQATPGQCDTEGANTVAATLANPCGVASCPVNVSSGLSLANTCPTPGDPSCGFEFVRKVNAADNATVEVCTPVTLTNTLNMTGVPATLTWHEITFREQARNGLTMRGYAFPAGGVESGEALVTVTDGTHTCSIELAPTDTTAAGEIEWNLGALDDLATSGGCGFAIPPTNSSVTITYDVTTGAPNGGFFDWGRFIVDDDATMTCDGTINEPIELTVQRATMAVALTLPQQADVCDADTVMTLTLTKSGAYATYDNTLFVSTTDFDIITDPSDPAYIPPRISGGIPDVGTPIRTRDVGNGEEGVYWLIGDLPASFVSGTLTVPVRKRCGSASTFVRLAYDDKCENDDTNNIDQNSLSATTTGAPVIDNSADVTVTVTPEQAFATVNPVHWTIYAVNGGAGVAHDLQLTATLNGALSYVNANVYDQNGTALPSSAWSSEVLPIPDSSQIVFHIDAIPAGLTYHVDLETRIVGCDSLIVDVQGQWGCIDQVCQSGAQLHDRGEVLIPETQVIVTSSGPATMGACDPDSIAVTLTNSSASQISGVELSQFLPLGVAYVPGTTTMSIAHSFGNTLPTVTTVSGAAADPFLVGDKLLWLMRDHLSTDYLSSGDVVSVRFQVQASTQFAGGDLRVSGEYKTLCGQKVFSQQYALSVDPELLTPTDFTVTRDIPAVQVCTDSTKGDSVTWSFTVTNNDPAATAYGVQLVDQLAPGLTLLASSVTHSTLGLVTPAPPDRPSSGDTGTLTWKLGDAVSLAPGQSLVLTLKVANLSADNCTAFDDGLNTLDVSLRGCADAATAPAVALGPFVDTVRRLEPAIAVTIDAVDLTPNCGLAPGDTIRFDITYRNSGDGIARGIRLEHYFTNSALTYVNSTLLGALYFGRVEILGQTLGAGEIKTWSVYYRINQPVGNAFTINSTASATDGCCADSAADARTDIIDQQISLNVQKSATEGVARPGQQATYLLTVENTTCPNLTNVVLRDNLGGGQLEYVTSTYDFSHVVYDGIVSGQAQWTITSLPSGGTEQIRVTTLVPASLGLGAIANTAAVTSATLTSGQPLTANGLDSDTETLPIALDSSAVYVDVSSMVPSITPGTQQVVELTVVNNGSSLLDAAHVDFTLPAGLSYVTSTYDSTALSFTGTPSAPQWSFTDTLVSAGVQHIRLVLAAAANVGAIATPVVMQVSASGIDVEGRTVTDEDHESLPITAGTPALSFDKIATTTRVTPGGDVGYVLTVLNSGDVDLTGVTVTDPLASGLSYRASDFDPARVQFLGASPNPSWLLTQPLQPGQAEQIELFVTASANIVDYGFAVPSADSIANVASVTGTDPSGTVVSVSDGVTLPFFLPPSALTLAKTALTTEIVPGAPLAYQLVLTNTGNQTLTGVVVTEPPLAGLTYSGSTYDGALFGFHAGNDTLYWAMGAALAPGATSTIRVDYLAAANASALASPTVNVATASGLDQNGQAVSGSGTASLDVKALAARLQLDKIALDAAIHPGEPTAFLLTARNSGEQTLTAVTITEADLAGQGLTYSGWTGDATHISYALNGTDHVWTVDTLRAGEQQPIRVTFATAADPAALASPVTNTATASATDQNGGTVAANATASVPVVVPGASIRADITATQSAILPGSDVVYTVHLTNNGEQPLTNAQLALTLPAGLSYVSSDFDSTAVIFSGSSAAPQWSIAGAFAAGLEEEFRVVLHAAADQSTIANPSYVHVTATAQTSAGGSVSDDDGETLPLQLQTASMHVTKLASRGVVVPGETVDYTITVQNDGNQPITNVDVTETVPVGLLYVNSNYDAAAVSFTGNAAAPVWHIASLPLGALQQIRASFVANADPSAIVNPVVNTVAVTGTDPSGNAVSANGTESLPVQNPGESVSLDKISVESVLVPGSLTTYVLTLVNSGTSPLVQVAVSEQVPQGLTYVSTEYDAARFTFSALPQPTWTLVAGDTLKPTELEQIRVKFYAAADPDSLQDPTINGASVTGVAVGGGPVFDSDNASLPVQLPNAKLTLHKTALESIIVPGQTISYQLLVTNTGNQALHTVRLSDTVPAGLTYQSSNFVSSRVHFTGTALAPSWTLDSLAIGGSEEVRVTFAASSNPAVLSNPTLNTASVSGFDITNHTVTDAASESVPVQSSGAALSVNKLSLASVVVPGAEVPYLITVTNIGDQTLSNVAVADQVPAGMTYASSDWDHAHVTFNASTTAPVWTVTSMTPGASELIRVTLRASDDPAAIAQPVTNVATATGTGASGQSVTASDSDQLPLQAQMPALTVDKVALAGILVPGEQVSYLITATNTGDVDLTNVIVTDLPGAGLSFVSSSYNTNAATFTGTPDAPAWTFASLAVGRAEQIRVTFATAANEAAYTTQPVPNTATAQGAAPSGVVNAPPVTETLPLQLKRAAIDLEKTLTAVVGTRLFYEMEVTNNGDQTLSNVTVSDPIPSELLYVSAEPLSYVSSVVRLDGATTVNFTLPGTLSPGSSSKITLIADLAPGVPNGEAIANIATALGTDESGHKVSDVDGATYHVASPTVTVEKTVDRAQVAPGDLLTYTLLVRNVGTEPVRDFVLTDAVPSHTTYVGNSATAGGSYQATPAPLVTWTLPELARGAVWQVSFQTRVDDATPLGTMLANAALAAGDNLPPTPSDSTHTTVQRATVVLEKQVSRTQAAAGDTLVYTVLWRNTAATAAPLSISDAVPPATTYVTGSATPSASFDVATHTLGWSLGTVSGYASGTVSFRAVVRSDVTAATEIDNVAMTGDGTPSNMVRTLVGDGQLTIDKAVDRTVASAGDDLLYTLRYANHTTIAQTGVVVRDVVPAGTAYIAGSAQPSAGFTASGQALTWALQTVLPGASGTLTFRVHIDAGVANDARLTNIATIESDRLPATSSAPVTTTLIFPTLTLAKSATPAMTQVGGHVSYSVLVTNSGSGTARAARITDTPPAGFVYDAGSARYDGQPLEPSTASAGLVFAVGDVLPHSVHTLTYTMLVGATVGEGTAVNSAVLAATDNTGHDLTVGPAHAPVDVGAPRLVVTKTVDRGHAEVGDQVRFTVTVSNPSTVDALTAWIEDTPDAGFRYLAGTSMLDGAHIADPAGTHTLAWPVGTIRAGQTLTLTYGMLVDTGAHDGVQRNRVTVRSVDLLGHESRTPPVVAELQVVQLHLTGSVYGRAWVDCDDNHHYDAGEPVLPNVDVYLDDGRHARTNEQGFYYMDGVDEGDRVLTFDSRDLPEGAVILGDGSPSHFLHVWEGGRSYINLRVCASRLELGKSIQWLPQLRLSKSLLDLGKTAGGTHVDARYMLRVELHGCEQLQGATVYDVMPADAEIVASRPRAEIPDLDEESLEHDTPPTGGLRARHAAPPWPTDLGDSLRLVRWTLPALTSDEPVEIAYTLRFDPSRGAARLFNRAYVSAPVNAGGEGTPATDGAFGTIRLSTPAEVETGAVQYAPAHPDTFRLTSAFFTTSKADLRFGDPLGSPEKLLEAVRDTLLHYPASTAYISGHTDPRPIHTPEFPSNWELSRARAASVARYLSEHYGIAPSRITSEGFADTKPRVPNDSPEHMQLNRRVEIIVDTQRPGALLLDTAQKTAAIEMPTCMREPTAWADVAQVPAGVGAARIRLALTSAYRDPLGALTLTDVLPPGAHYAAGSAKWDDGASAGEPQISDAADGTTTLTWTLGELQPGVHTLGFDARFDPAAPPAGWERMAGKATATAGQRAIQAVPTRVTVQQGQ